jgi:hypothetical protein
LDDFVTTRGRKLRKNADGTTILLGKEHPNFILISFQILLILSEFKVEML